MTKSMTAYARHEHRNELGLFSWEIRSVNHRYLEASLRIDESFRPLEIELRKVIAAKLNRGKVEAVMRYQPPQQQQTSVELDNSLASALINTHNQLAAEHGIAAKLDLLRIMQWPGVMVHNTLDLELLQDAVINSLQLAVDDLLAMRQREGEALKQMISQRCEQILVIADEVAVRLPEILDQQRSKLQEKVAEFNLNLDPERLEQEMVLLAQKTDVAEEIDRLKSHVAEVLSVLQRNEPVGRRLDFLMQELNREANTLGSKSIDTSTTRYSVDLKVLIEQMREQIQNIE
ncbi:YicC/YloC family endoribonuclease [Methylophaga lonarensis]|uniref:YicC/YloC family endoribonuclease n=1 Tax=Methylophaga lonarensis TaxID=999151 RepID=UPI003D2C8291